MIHKLMQNESQRLQAQIAKIQAQLKKLPPGKLICTHTGKYQKWYQSDGHTPIYIPKKNQQLAEQLALKKYLTLLSEDLSHEKKSIDTYIKQSHRDNPKSESLLLDSSPYHKLLSSHFQTSTQKASEWASQAFLQNPKNPEQLIHKTISGKYVRSKSEAMIDMFLFNNEIPYRYECALELSGITLFPDFTILHPKTGQLLYWEHFGLMDEPAYAQNVASKLKHYISHKIIPSINLITTYETKDQPLTSDLIEKIISYYFL